jgi:hypothetical protein
MILDGYLFLEFWKEMETRYYSFLSPITITNRGRNTQKEINPPQRDERKEIKMNNII